jgi:hypothetical protein
MEKTLGELVDELTILQLKQERLDPSDATQERIYLLSESYKQKIQSLLPIAQAKAREYREELYWANREIWNLEESMRNVMINKWFSDLKEMYFELGKRAESIRKVNKHRVLYKEKMNNLTKEYIDKKGGHLSEATSNTET